MLQFLTLKWRFVKLNKCYFLIINFQWKMRGCNESVGPADLATAIGNTSDP